MNQRLAKTIHLLNRNTGFMILMAVILFGSAIIAIQNDNQALLRDHDEQRESRLQAVETVTMDAHQNTEELLARMDRVERLTCGILLLHDPNLTTQLSAELVELCENELEFRNQPVAPEPEPEQSNQPAPQTPLDPPAPEPERILDNPICTPSIFPLINLCLEV